MVYIYILGRKLVERDLVLMVGVTYISFWIKNGDFPLFFSTNISDYKHVHIQVETLQKHSHHSFESTKASSQIHSQPPFHPGEQETKVMHTPLFFLHHLLSFLPFGYNILPWPKNLHE
jgi:hypothetical protein